MSSPFTLKWGIISTGWIAGQFVNDLLTDPSTRSVSDVQHKVVAVGSRSKENAEKFIAETWEGKEGAKDIKAYATYEDLYADKDVSAVYIGTPHSHHYRNVKDALLAGKHVLCEKPVTVNAKQFKELAGLAKEKKLFFMEAVWTRFFPITYEIQKIIRDGTIGSVRLVQADFGVSKALMKMDPTHRLIDPKLAGGSMLDLGPYPWTWIALTMLHPILEASPVDGPLPLPKVKGSLTYATKALEARLGGPIDESAFAILSFPSTEAEADKTAIFSTSLTNKTPNDRANFIQGTKGNIIVHWPPYAPHTYTVQTWSSEDSFLSANAIPDHEETKTVEVPGGARGFAYEADETARCVRDGKLESDRMPHRESILMMEVFDEIRKQGGLAYPQEIEKVD